MPAASAHSMSHFHEEAAEREYSLMPEDYLERVPAARRERHLALICGHPGYPGKAFLENPVSWHLTRGVAHHELLTYSFNTPFAFEHVTAAVALQGGSIYNAEIFPRRDGTVVIEVAFELTDQPSISRVEDTIEALFNPSNRHPPAPVCEPVKGLTVSGETGKAGQPSVIEIRALDVRGLLYRIARSFAVMSIKVVRAEVHTSTSGEVHDRFYVVDRLGRPVDVAREAQSLARTIVG